MPLRARTAAVVPRPGMAKAAWIKQLEAGASVPIALIPQQGENWCWAACAEMVDRARNASKATTQCALATQYLRAPLCCGTLPPRSDCDKALGLSNVQTVWAGLGYGGERSGVVRLSVVADELRENRPVQLCVGDGRLRHLVLIVGVNHDSTQYTLLDPLPRNSGATVYLSAPQLLAGWGLGPWSDTWIGI